MEMIGADVGEGATERSVLIFVGDYVDRGLESRQVLDFLLDYSFPTSSVVYLKGNHEAWLLAFLGDAAVAHDWLPNGGAATLLSYGVTAIGPPYAVEALEEARLEFRAALPDAHLRFLQSLVGSHVEGDYAFVHAGVRYAVPLEEQDEQDLLWLRGEFLSDRRDHGRLIVHGHSVVDEPDVRVNRIGIDTGAYATGRLTCLVADGTSRRFLTT